MWWSMLALPLFICLAPLLSLIALASRRGASKGRRTAGIVAAILLLLNALLWSVGQLHLALLFAEGAVAAAALLLLRASQSRRARTFAAAISLITLFPLVWMMVEAVNILQNDLLSRS